MKVHLFLATPDKKIQEYFGKYKYRIFPKDILDRYSLSPQDDHIRISIWNPERENLSQSDFENYIISRIKGSDVGICIIDQCWDIYSYRIKDSIAFFIFNSLSISKKNLQNFFYAVTASSVKSVMYINNLISSEADKKLLALPLRNFNDRALGGLSEVFRDYFGKPNFNLLVDENMSNLRRCIKKRPRSKYRERNYIVDSQSRYFSYGFERHSRFETGGPHLPSCQLNGQFRFGSRLDEVRHYNVSKGDGDTTTITGQFIDCHNSTHAVSVRTHLNMFANDFFGE